MKRMWSNREMGYKARALREFSLGSVERRVREWRPVVTTRNLTLQGMKFQHCFLRHLQSQGIFFVKVMSFCNLPITWNSIQHWSLDLLSSVERCGVILCIILRPNLSRQTCQSLRASSGPLIFLGFVRELCRGFLLLTWPCLLSKQADFAPTDCTYTRLS